MIVVEEGYVLAGLQNESFGKLIKNGPQRELGNSRDEAIAILIQELKCFFVSIGSLAGFYQSNKLLKVYCSVSFFRLKNEDKK